jgi:hypothetical protein
MPAILRQGKALQPVVQMIAMTDLGRAPNCCQTGAAWPARCSQRA